MRLTIAAIIAFVAALLLTAAPVQASDTHRAYLPVVAAGPAPKAGIAFSSHRDAAQRVAMLGDTVSHWRGWQTSRPQVERWGLRPVQALWCDFYYHPQFSNGTLRNQLDWLKDLSPDFDGYLLFLNEPDWAYHNRWWQCAVDPTRAAMIYTHVKAILPEAKLVGPGISHIDYNNGFSWLGAWYNEVVRITGEPPEMYAWDVHNYLHDGDPLAPYDALENWLAERGVYNPKFWISEWGARTPERTLEMRRAFDSDSRIIAHNWYDQYAAWWDGDNRPLQLFVGGEEGGGPIRLSRLGIAFVYDRLPAPGEVERGALPQME